VVERDGDVFGTTVNVASRIANHAPAGTILVSEPVILAAMITRIASNRSAMSRSAASWTR